MSLTIGSHKPASRVRIGGEHDVDGARGFVLLEVTPNPAQLTRKAARDVARALQRFAEIVRGASLKRRPPPNYRGKAQRSRKA
jgi:hypothetical protein